MNFLLDAHVVLWRLADLPEISSEINEMIDNPDTLILVSAATVWEIEIKRRLGKLEAPDDLLEALEKSRFDTLPVNASHAREAAALPDLHRDPFDRMLVAQGRLEALTIMTRDKTIPQYDVSVLKA